LKRQHHIAEAGVVVVGGAASISGRRE